MTEEKLTEAVEKIPETDMESLTYSNGEGSFLIESETDEQDADEIDELLEEAGYERDGFLEAPDITQQWFKPIEDAE
jgi:hypothetical protein